jgi:hypothetical protein
MGVAAGSESRRLLRAPSARFEHGALSLLPIADAV